jgi:acyl carrier protein
VDRSDRGRDADRHGGELVSAAFEDGLFRRLGALWIDHVAVTTADLEATCRAYLSMPGGRLLRGPGWNPDQNVHYAFIRFADGPCIEALAPPAEGDTPIRAHLERGGGAYHVCYAVEDLDAAMGRVEALGCRVAVPPRPDAAHDGRRVTFLLHPDHGLFELVEAYGSLAAADAAAPAPAAGLERAGPGGGDVEETLVEAMVQILPSLSSEQARRAAAGHTPGWDSLGHLRLIMEIERRFEIRIPSNRVSELTSYDALRRYLLAAPATARDR